MSAFQKHEAAYLASRKKYDTLQAQMNADAEALEVARNNAREATERMQEKSKEIEALRLMRGVDEREREVKIDQLTGKGNRKSWFG
jgi:uncharacterized protein YhaN